MSTTGTGPPGEHRALRELLGALALGRLDPPEEPAVRAHLAGCAACRAELAELTPMAGLLQLADPAHLAPVAGPPPELGRQIAAQVAAEDELRRRRSRRRRTTLVAAAAAGVLLAGTGGAVLLDRDSPPTVVAVPSEPVPLIARQPGLEVRSAVLVPHTWGLEVTVVLTGLRPGERYRAVAVDRAGRQQPAGEFLGVSGRAATCDLQAALLRQDAGEFLLLDAAGAVIADARLPA